jgi:hypothetical protein
MTDYAKCCQWVVGEPCGERTVFCSKPTVALGESYCLHHFMLVYRSGYIPLGKKEEELNDDR